MRIDLSELGFMDSTGLRALLALRATAMTSGSGARCSPPVQRLLELTQTLEILPFE